MAPSRCPNVASDDVARPDHVSIVGRLGGSRADDSFAVNYRASVVWNSATLYGANDDSVYVIVYA